MKLQDHSLSNGTDSGLEQTSPRVHGRVTTPGGRPATGVLVRAFDRNLRTERLLGEITTDEKGEYEIGYSLEQLKGAEKDSADLVVRALPESAPPAASPIRFNARPEETIDLTVALADPSEYETLVEEIEPLCEGVPIEGLRQDSEHRDVSFLAGETGRSEMHIAFLILAHRHAQSTGLPAAAFYGLFRDGMPTDLAELQEKSALHLEAALRAAVQRNVVPAELGEDAATLAERLVDSGITESLRGKEGEAPSPLGAVLSLALPEPEQQKHFLRALLDHQGPAEALWERLPETQGFSATPGLEKVRWAVELGALTQNHAPLVERLLGRREAGNLGEIRDLAGFDTADWEELVREAGGPPADIPGNDTEEKTRNYAQALELGFEEAFPTAALAARLQKDPELGESAAAEFLASHPELDLRTANLETLLGDGEKDLKRGLQGVQRLFKIAPRFREWKPLRDGGLDSAHAIARHSRNAFVEEHAEALGTVRAGKIHDRASQIAATALTLVAEYAPAFQGPGFQVLTGDAPAGKRAPGVPDWETLFGSGDFCECDHCRSVYSPAAYLVDILDFLNDRKTLNTEDPAVKIPVRNILFERRPDLGEIKLTCENTNTPLPYVDLVNEILESAVSPSTAVPAKNRQTTGTAAELAAHPQHENPGAYVKLRDAVFPWSLPFDLRLEESRTYLGHLGVPRWQLMEVFRTTAATDVETDRAIAGERLGFSVKEREAVVTPLTTAGAKTWEPYGFSDTDSTTWVTTMSKVRTFLDRTGLSYDELDRLLELRFINPTPKIVIKPEDPTKPTCDTTKLVLKDLTGEALDRIHRFVRLWRRLGWPMRDVDRALFALRAGAIDKDLLTELSALQRLTAELDLPLHRLLAFYAPLDTFEYGGVDDKPLYDRLFLSSGETGLFALNTDRSELAIVTSTGTGTKPTLEDSKVAAILLGALSLTADELAALISGPDAIVTTARELRLANLTRLARCVFLARALRLRMIDFLRLVKLSGTDPFSSLPDDLATRAAVEPAVPARTLLLIETVRKLAESGFTIAEVDLLLRGGTDSASPATPPDAVLARVLEEIRTELRRSLELTDSRGDHTRRQLTLLGWRAERVEEALGTLLGTLAYTAPLAALPAGVTPESLPATLVYDPQAKTLQFLGPMTLAEKTALLARSSDSPYQTAIEALFQAPRRFVTDQMNEFFPQADVPALFDRAISVETRLGLVLTRLMPSLRRAGSEALMRQKVGAALGLDAATGEALLGTWLRSPSHPGQLALLDLLVPSFLASEAPVTRGAFPKQMNALSLAYRVVFVISRLGIGARQLPWAIGRATAAGWLDLNTLPLESQPPAFSTWMRLLDLVRLRNGLPDGEAALTRIFTLADQAGTTLETLEKEIAKETGWSSQDVKSLDAGFGFTSREAFKNEKALLRLQPAFALLGRLGVSAARALEWRRTEPTQEDAREARQAARARSGDTEWLAVARPLRDALRERQRSCLVAYLVPRPGTGQSWKDANGLFQHFLIDVEMSPCQLTSRLKQAISSVQLFVQRCLMNLEPKVQADTAVDAHWQEWKWMKSYRVWEAGRKVFLYPESFVEPDLRDDKSPFCKDLEGELLQRELTNEVAEEAFLHYLEKLDAVARLDVQGVYHQIEPGVDILHVFARTRHTPHRYFHRTRVDSYRWTAWQQMDLDIEGDHLIPIVWNRRLHLFWAVFTLESESKPVTVTSGSEVPPANKYWRIQLAWSELKNGKWQPKKLTRESLETTKEQTPPQLSAFRFWPGAHETRGDLKIFVAEIEVTSAVHLSSLGHFVFTSCHGTVLTVTEARTVALPLPMRTFPWGMELIEKKETGETKEPLYLGLDVSAEALAKTPFLPEFPSPFRLLVVSRIDEGTVFGNVFKSPFFFSDQERTLFVAPTKPAPGLKAVEKEDLRTADSFALLGDEVSPLVIQPPAGPVKTQGLDFLLQPPALGGHISTGLPAARALAGPTAAQLLAGSSGSTGAGGLRLAGTKPAFRFYTFHHPYVCLFIRELNRLGVGGLLTRRIQVEPWVVDASSPFDFFDTYGPNTTLIDPRYPQEDVDFDPRGAYAPYNWELFFYIPLTIAVRLSKNQRFEEAERWFHRIFNPTDMSDKPAPQRYWQTRPFFEATETTYTNQRIEELLQKLASGKPDEDLAQSVLDWRKNPFNPHAVARLRTTAYQKAVVMSYLDHLVAWGDQLFRRDTLESLNEATQIYVLAAEILGRRPERVKARAAASPQSYNDLGSRSFAALSGPLAAAELLVPEASADLALADADLPQPPRFLLSTFCVPKNDKLLGYWDLVADRLFKLRHCLNIEGVERQLALFEPPIDPALLVRAAAAGLDLGRVLADANAVLPRFRFNTMVAKATELCGEVKALGGALLAALEKRDAEALALLRSSQECRVLEAAREVRQKQIDEAKETLAGLEESRKLAEKKKEYYSSRVRISPGEQEQADKALDAGNLQAAAAAFDWLASIIHLVPSFKIGSPFSIGITFGGNDIGGSAKGVAGSLGLTSGALSAVGAQAGTMAGYTRREEEWQFQLALANQEIIQINRQIAAAQVRLAIAEKELTNHDLQVSNSLEIEAFLQDKYTNGELYNWMISQISGVYFQAYQLAYDVAKRAELAYRFELALDGSSFIQFGYWDSLRKGLLAGERLSLDLKRLEVAYLEENRREYEISKRVSLALLDPLALLKLKTTGECFVSLPEALFDLNTPGHYLRRLKSVGLTIPCIAGPYTGIHCTLTLLRSSVRHSNLLLDGKYPRQPNNETRFRDSIGSIQSIVTSGATEDSGLFETSLQDARYLPFEGAGAISEWRLQLPASFRSFDYNTISDAVLHLRYTAREGGDILRSKAVAGLREALNTLLGASTGLSLRVSARHDFPGAWARFMSPAKDDDQVLSLDLSKDRFPFLVQDRTIKVKSAQALLQIKETAIVAYVEKDDLKVTLAPPSGTSSASDVLTSSASFLGGMPNRTFTLASPHPVGSSSMWTLTAAKDDVKKIAPALLTPDLRLKPSVVEDLQLILHYTIEKS
jgi:hypothetical protein